MLKLSADYPCCSIESTNLSCQRVKVVKATVFTVRWDTAHTPHCVKIPGARINSEPLAQASKRCRSGFQKAPMGSF